MPTTEDQVTLVAVQIQLSEIKGILSTVVGEHSRRITDNEAVGRQLRVDLTAVNDNAVHRVSELRADVNKMAEIAHKENNITLSAMSTRITTNSNNIAELKEDVKETKEKQNATFGKVVMVLSPILAFIALIWNVIGK